MAAPKWKAITALTIMRAAEDCNVCVNYDVLVNVEMLNNVSISKQATQATQATQASQNNTGNPVLGGYRITEEEFRKLMEKQAQKQGQAQVQGQDTQKA